MEPGQTCQVSRETLLPGPLLLLIFAANFEQKLRGLAAAALPNAPHRFGSVANAARIYIRSCPNVKDIMLF